MWIYLFCNFKIKTEQKNAETVSISIRKLNFILKQIWKLLSVLYEWRILVFNAYFLCL